MATLGSEKKVSIVNLCHQAFLSGIAIIFSATRSYKISFPVERKLKGSLLVTY